MSTGMMESFWPGWWSQDYNVNLPGCSYSRKDPNCWEEVPGRFVSDMDVYMEFDDRDHQTPCKHPYQKQIYRGPLPNN